MTKSNAENMEEASSPLLGRLGNLEEGDTNDPVTAVVISSTIIAVLGSYVFGSAQSKWLITLVRLLIYCEVIDSVRTSLLGQFRNRLCYHRGGSLFEGIAVGYSSPAQSGIVNDLGLSLADYSLFGSILTIGAMVGAITSGKIADSFGRRPAMGFSELFCLMGWIAIAFSKTAWLLDIGRLSIGYGIGTLSYAVPIYIAEITPKNVRGVFTALNQMMICFGVSVMYLTGTLISWRVLALIGIVPGILQLLGLFFIPESPRWLAKTGRWTDCETSLQRLRGEKADISKEAAEIKEYTECLQDFSSSQMSDLFQRKYHQALLIGVGIMVLQQFGGVNAIAYYASSIFETAGFSGRIGSIAMVVVQVPTTVVGTFLTDRCGRRPLLLVSSAGTCLGSLLIATSFLLQDLQQLQTNPILALVGVLIFTGSFSIGMGGIPWVIMSEIFPINVKGMAASLVIVVNWLGSWIVSYSFNFFLEMSSQDTFFLFGCISALTIIFVAKLVPETKGRTLEEIQASMVLLS